MEMRLVVVKRVKVRGKTFGGGGFGKKTVSRVLEEKRVR